MSPLKAMPNTSNIFLIGSGKGGVGKTWLSITLAHQLAMLGKRVLLFDGDLGLANIDIQLGLMPENDLANVIESGLSLEDVIVAYPHKSDKNIPQFDVITGRSGSGSLATLPPQKFSNLIQELQQLAESYDVVLVDLGAGIDQTVQKLCQIGGTCLVVITDEPTSITDAYAFIKVIHNQAPKLNMQIIVNMVEHDRTGQDAYDTIARVCTTFLQQRPMLAGFIHRDSRIKDCIRHQTSILLRYPHAPVTDDVLKLAEYIGTVGVKRTLN